MSAILNAVPNDFLVLSGDDSITLPLIALGGRGIISRSEEHTSELQSLAYLVCRLLLEKKKNHVNRGRLFRHSQRDVELQSPVHSERSRFDHRRICRQPGEPPLTQLSDGDFVAAYEEAD